VGFRDVFRAVRPALIAVAVVSGLLAFVARLVILGTGRVNIWEATSVLFAFQSPRELLRSLAYDVHPPLFFLIGAIWVKLFGAAPLSLRLFGGVCSGLLAATAAATSWYLSEAGEDRRVLSALTAGLYAALSPAAVASTGLFRMYGLTALVALLLFWCAVVVVKRPSRGGLIGIAVLGATLGYLHYVGVMLCVALLCAWLWTAPARAKTRWRVAAAIAFAWTIFWAPWAFTVARQTAGYYEAAPATDTLVAVAQSLCYWLIGFREAPATLAVPATLLAAVLFLVLIRRAGPSRLVLGGAAVGAVLLTTSALLLQPIVTDPRFWGPIMLLAVVGTTATLAKRAFGLQLVASGILLATQLLGLLHTPPQLEWVGARRKLLVMQFASRGVPVTLVARPAEAVMLEYHRRLRGSDNVRIFCLTEMAASRHEPQRAALPRDSWVTYDDIQTLEPPIYLVQSGRALPWTPGQGDRPIP